MAESEALRDLVPVLAALSRWLNDQQVRYAIIGGVAIGFVGQPRITQDVDAGSDRRIGPEDFESANSFALRPESFKPS